MSLQIKPVIKKQMKLGEGPHWDEGTQSLYLVDIYEGSIFKYDSKTGSHAEAKVCTYQKIGRVKAPSLATVLQWPKKEAFFICLH